MREITIEQQKNPTFKFVNLNDSIKGLLMVKKTVNVNGEDKEIYEVEKEDGIIYTVWGTKQMNERMSFVNVGDVVEIKFSETKKVKGRALPMKVFQVFVEEGSEVDLEDIV